MTLNKGSRVRLKNTYIQIQINTYIHTYIPTYILVWWLILCVNLIGYQVPRLNIISECVVRVFPHKISIWTGDPPLCGSALSNLLRVWIEKRWRKEEFTPLFCLIVCAGTHLVIFCPQTGICTIKSSGSQAWGSDWIIPPAFLGL